MRYLTAVLTAVLVLAGVAFAAKGQAKAPARKGAPAGKSAASAAKSKPSTKASARKVKGRTIRRRGRAVARGQTTPARERIVEIQQALARSGHYRKEPTGQFDAYTSAALGSFQEANGLQRTGKLGAWTLKKLAEFGLPPVSREWASQSGSPVNH